MPRDTWRRVRALLGGPAMRLPATFPLAVTTLIGASPLVAGLVDDGAPVALAVLDDGGRATLVAGVHVKSGPELVVALVNGADASFTSDPHPDAGLTVLALKGEPNGIALGVTGDTLVVSATRRALLAAAGYVARTLTPSLPSGEALTLVARKAALVGSLSALIRASFHDALESLEIADRASRAQHGRGPDFADPPAVIEALTGLADGALAALASASEVSASAMLLGPIPELRIEIVPERTGVANELVRDIAVGDASSLLALPASTELAVLWRRAESSGEPSIAERATAVFGERLSPRERTRVSAWASDVERGTGAVTIAGVFQAGSDGPGVFVVGPNGDGPSLRRAILGVPSLLEIPALARPLHEFVGRFTIRPAKNALPGLGSTTELLVRRAQAPGASGARAGALSVDIVAASVEPRVAIVAGPKGSGFRIGDLMKASQDGVGADPVVVRAVAGAGTQVATAALVRFRDESGAGWAALGIGSDRRVGWIELTTSDIAARALLRFCLAP